MTRSLDLSSPSNENAMRDEFKVGDQVRFREQRIKGMIVNVVQGQEKPLYLVRWSKEMMGTRRSWETGDDLRRV